MAVYQVINLDHLRAGFPANLLSEIHLTITTDREFHITIVSRDGTRNNYFYDSSSNFIYQRGAHAGHYYNNYTQAYNNIESEAKKEYSYLAAYIA